MNIAKLIYISGEYCPVSWHCLISAVVVSNSCCEGVGVVGDVLNVVPSMNGILGVG